MVPWRISSSASARSRVTESWAVGSLTGPVWPPRRRPASPATGPSRASDAVRGGPGADGGAVVAAYQGRERGHLGGQGAAAVPGDAHPGTRPAALVALLDRDQARLGQHGQVPGQVAGGEVELPLQVAEVDPAGLRGDGEDAEPVPLVHDVVEVLDRVRLLGHADRRRASPDRVPAARPPAS